MCVEQLVSSFLKNDREMVAGEISPHAGRCWAHVRIFVPSAREEGEWIRTDKGVAITTDRFPEIRAAVEKLRSVAGLERTVAQIPLGNNQIRVGVTLFKGRQFAEIRSYYKRDDKWLPSPKGVTVRIELLDDLVGLVTALDDACRATLS